MTSDLFSTLIIKVFVYRIWVKLISYEVTRATEQVTVVVCRTMTSCLMFHRFLHKITPYKHVVFLWCVFAWIEGAAPERPEKHSATKLGGVLRGFHRGRGKLRSRQRVPCLILSSLPGGDVNSVNSLSLVKERPRRVFFHVWVTLPPFPPLSEGIVASTGQSYS